MTNTIDILPVCAVVAGLLLSVEPAELFDETNTMYVEKACREVIVIAVSVNSPKLVLVPGVGSH